mmetsp:Transcript_20031/g.56279  ORF Transcript_20031/g.56279 Transcript_20031/m.56279 type:complete len:246 (+) Transcript_20031:786-1523(+)
MSCRSNSSFSVAMSVALFSAWAWPNCRRKVTISISSSSTEAWLPDLALIGREGGGDSMSSAGSSSSRMSATKLSNWSSRAFRCFVRLRSRGSGLSLEGTTKLFRPLFSLMVYCPLSIFSTMMVSLWAYWYKSMSSSSISCLSASFAALYSSYSFTNWFSSSRCLPRKQSLCAFRLLSCWACRSSVARMASLCLCLSVCSRFCIRRTSSPLVVFPAFICPGSALVRASSCDRRFWFTSRSFSMSLW